MELSITTRGGDEVMRETNAMSKVGLVGVESSRVLSRCEAGDEDDEGDVCEERDDRHDAAPEPPRPSVYTIDVSTSGNQ